MIVESFKNDNFGSLTTILNEETGEINFIAKEICSIFGTSNISQSIKSAKLEPNEFKVVSLKNDSEFKKYVHIFNIQTSKAPTITIISESGLYKLILASKKKNAQPFKNWVTKEVLPTIRKTGSYTVSKKSNPFLLEQHLDKGVQKQNSKDINTKNFNEKGMYGAINYNKKSCMAHTGLNPKQIKEQGRENGLKAIECSSAKETLRNTNPEIACAMSFTDSLVSKGNDFDEVCKMSLELAKPLFKKMIEIGISPKELTI